MLHETLIVYELVTVTVNQYSVLQNTDMALCLQLHAASGESIHTGIKYVLCPYITIIIVKVRVN